MLYFTSIDIFKRMTLEQLGEYVMKEMLWLNGETDEPYFKNDLQFCSHIRNKEIMEAKKYNAKKQRECRERKNQQAEPIVSVYTEPEDKNEDNAPKGYDTPSKEECLFNLHLVYMSQGEMALEREANKIYKLYGYEVKDLVNGVKEYK